MSTMQVAQVARGGNAAVLPKPKRINAFNLTPPQLPELPVLKRQCDERLRGEALEWQRMAVQARARAHERGRAEARAAERERDDVQAAAVRARGEREAEAREWLELLARAKSALAAEETEWRALRARASL